MHVALIGSSPLASTVWWLTCLCCFVPSPLAAWHDAAVHRAYQRQVVGAAAARLRHQAVWGAWSAWQSRVESSRAARSQLAAAVDMWQRSRLRAAWGAWQAHCAFRRHARAVLARFSQQLLARAYAGWREAAARRAELASRLAACLQRWQNRALASAFEGEACTLWGAWKTGMPAGHWRALVLTSPPDACLPPAAWRAAHLQKQQLNEKLEAAVARWAHSTLAAAFAQWRESAAEAQGQRRALARFCHATLAKAWAAWRWYRQECCQQQQRLQAAVDHWLRGALAAAFAQVGRWWMCARWPPAPALPPCVTERQLLYLPAPSATAVAGGGGLQGPAALHGGGLPGQAAAPQPARGFQPVAGLPAAQAREGLL